MPPRRIGPLWALLIAFFALMAGNSCLKRIFGVGEIATDVPFPLTGFTLFAIWKINRRGGNLNTQMGSARFGGRKEAHELEKTGDLIIGRSGKGVGTIIPNLLLLDRLVICIDPKGENARVTACTRVRKGDVWCLDPFGVSGRSAARYNPLARLDPASPELAETHRRSPTRWSTMRRGKAHWNEEAKPLESSSTALNHWGFTGS